MPRPKRSKVTPSAPTAVPFLQKVAAARQPALMSGALPTKDTNVSSKAAAQKGDLYGVNDKENEIPELVPSSYPTELSIAPSVTLSKLRGTPQAATSHKGSLLSSIIRRRGPATPRVGDSSMISLGDFKRRSRQPSILGIGCEDDTPSLSSLGGGDNISIALDHDNLEDFQPEDESTPLQRRRTPREKATRDQDISTPVAATRAGLKRKITPPDVQVRASQQTPLDSAECLGSPADSELLAVATEEEEEPELPAPKRRAITPPAEGTMALPQSSPENSETEATASPVKRSSKRQATRSTAARKPMSTATLQSLLPKRRNQPGKVSFEILHDERIPSSPTVPSGNEDGDDDEEYTVPGPRGGVKRFNQNAQGSQQTKTSKTASKSLKRNGAGAKSQPTVRRTYGRRSRGEEDSTEINDSLVAPEEDDSDDGIEHGRGAAPKREQAAVAKLEASRVAAKFAEIDAWDLEFEDVTGDFSSPPDAR